MESKPDDGSPPRSGRVLRGRSLITVLDSPSRMTRSQVRRLSTAPLNQDEQSSQSSMKETGYSRRSLRNPRETDEPPPKRALKSSVINEDPKPVTRRTRASSTVPSHADLEVKNVTTRRTRNSSVSSVASVSTSVISGASPVRQTRSRKRLSPVPSLCSSTSSPVRQTRSRKRISPVPSICSSTTSPIHQTRSQKRVSPEPSTCSDVSFTTEISEVSPNSRKRTSAGGKDSRSSTGSHHSTNLSPNSQSPDQKAKITPAQSPSPKLNLEKSPQLLLKDCLAVDESVKISGGTEVDISPKCTSAPILKKRSLNRLSLSSRKSSPMKFIETPFIESSEKKNITVSEDQKQISSDGKIEYEEPIVNLKQLDNNGTRSSSGKMSPSPNLIANQGDLHVGEGRPVVKKSLSLSSPSGSKPKVSGEILDELLNKSGLADNKPVQKSSSPKKSSPGFSLRLETSRSEYSGNCEVSSPAEHGTDSKTPPSSEDSFSELKRSPNQSFKKSPLSSPKKSTNERVGFKLTASSSEDSSSELKDSPCKSRAEAQSSSPQTNKSKITELNETSFSEDSFSKSKRSSNQFCKTKSPSSPPRKCGNERTDLDVSSIFSEDSSIRKEMSVEESPKKSPPSFSIEPSDKSDESFENCAEFVGQDALTDITEEDSLLSEQNCQSPSKSSDKKEISDTVTTSERSGAQAKKSGLLRDAAYLLSGGNISDFEDNDSDDCDWEVVFSDSHLSKKERRLEKKAKIKAEKEARKRTKSGRVVTLNTDTHQLPQNPLLSCEEPSIKISTSTSQDYNAATVSYHLQNEEATFGINSSGENVKESKKKRKLSDSSNIATSENSAATVSYHLQNEEATFGINSSAENVKESKKKRKLSDSSNIVTSENSADAQPRKKKAKLQIDQNTGIEESEKNREASSVSTETSQLGEKTSVITAEKRKKKKKRNKEFLTDHVNEGLSKVPEEVNVCKKKKKKLKNTSENVQNVEQETSCSADKSDKKPKKKKKVRILEKDPVTEELKDSPLELEDQSMKVHKKKKKRSMNVRSNSEEVNGTVELEELPIEKEDKPKSIKKRKKQSIIAGSFAEVGCETAEPIIKNSKKSMKKAQKQLKSFKCDENIHDGSDSDEAPTSFSFSAGKQAALAELQAAAENIKKQKDLKKLKSKMKLERINQQKLAKVQKKQQLQDAYHEFGDLSEGSKSAKGKESSTSRSKIYFDDAGKLRTAKIKPKRLPDELLETLSNLPASKNIQSSDGTNGRVEASDLPRAKKDRWGKKRAKQLAQKLESQKHKELEYIPLPAALSATRFGVVPLRNIMIAKRLQENRLAQEAANFKQQTLFGNRVRRTPISDILAYHKKLAAAGKDAHVRSTTE